MSREDLENLYRRCGALVLRRCRWFLRDEAAAEDAMHEVFIKVWVHRDTFAGRAVPLAWLYRTAERTCIDRLRKGRRETTFEDDAEQRMTEATLPPPATSDAGDNAAVRYIHTLDPETRQLALLYYVDELSQEEVAQALGISRKTVGKKLKRIEERAKRLLALEAGSHV